MFTLGIDLGGTNIKAGVCDDDGNIINKLSAPTSECKNADAIADAMAELCRNLLELSGFDNSDIEYVGIAAPGTVDLETNRVVFANNLPLFDYPLADEFLKRFDAKKVYLENDANAAAFGEALCGGAKGADNAIIITLGTGVGSGIIINGRIYSGFNYAGAELGHMVISENGRACTCGRKGCFEAYSSATGLINTTMNYMKKYPESLMWQIAEDNGGKVDGKTSFSAAEKGDTAAKLVVGEYIDFLSCGIINIINIFQPEILCIGGGISNAGEKLFRPLMEKVEKEQYSRYCLKTTKICMARLGNDAGITGAAMLGRQQ